MINPIERVRKESNLTKKELCAILNCSLAYVGQLESGAVSKPSIKLLEKLKPIGYDPQQLQKEYIQWKDKQREEIIRRVKG